MNNTMIGALSIAILAGLGVGGTTLGYKYAPETFNDIYKRNVATVEQAYIDKNDSLEQERDIYRLYDEEFIPLFYSDKNDIDRLDLLDPLTFKGITKEEVAKELVAKMDIYPPKPFIIESDGELKNICFIHSTDFRNTNGGADYYGASKCRIGFEEFKAQFSKFMSEQEVMSDVDAYITHYNQNATAEELADQTIYRYYFNLIAGIDASLQAIRKEEGLGTIKSYMDSKKDYVDDPYFLVYDYDSPFVKMVIQEAQAGNLPLEATAFDAFNLVHTRVKNILPNDKLIALMVNQYEIETRSNTARKGILEDKVFKELVEM